MNAELVPQTPFSSQQASVRLFGGWPFLAALDIFDAAVSGSDIRVDLLAPPGGPAAILPFWEDVFTVGTLAAGQYALHVDLYIDDALGPTFFETCGPWQVDVLPAPPVPTLGSIGTLVSVLLLAAVAIAALHRMP